MNVRLQSLVAQAEFLPDDAQDRLADAFERQLHIETSARPSPEEIAAVEWVLSQYDPNAPEPTDEELIAWAKEQEQQGVDFTPEELDRIRLLENEPFVPADPETLARLFAHRG